MALKRELKSCGKAMTEVELRVVDAAGKDASRP